MESCMPEYTSGLGDMGRENKLVWFRTIDIFCYYTDEFGYSE